MALHEKWLSSLEPIEVVIELLPRYLRRKHMVELLLLSVKVPQESLLFLWMVSYGLDHAFALDN